MSLRFEPTQIANQARTVLLDFYKGLEEKPTFENFYPVKTERILASVLKWTVEEVPFIGWAHHARIKAKCDHTNKVILLAVDEISPEEKKFTLAHELGHAVLHESSLSCTVEGLYRTRSKKKFRDLMTPEATRVENEANIFAREFLMPERAVRRYFFQLFGAESVWAHSKLVKTRVMPSFGSNQRDDYFKSVSFALAAYKPETETDSLLEFFGVSNQAMARRLRELRLVFP